MRLFLQRGLLLLLLNGTCRSQMTTPQPQLFHLAHAAMGTEFTLDLYAPDQAFAEHAGELAFDEIDRLEDLLSNYRASSELSRINREAALGPVTTDPETFRFLERSRYWSRESDGAFDITVGPLLRAWGFFFHGGRVPPASELEALRARIGWRRMELNAVDRSVQFTRRAPLELDPGSIGKGFAVDAVVPLLRQAGVQAALLSAGHSTVYAIGAPPGKEGWPIDVPDPLHPGRVASTVLLRDTSLSTGACTEKFFVTQGHRYCHIFDPRSLRPVEGVLQTTVIDPSATDSDALSTVVFVLSPADSRPIVESSPGRRALIFRQDEPPCVAIHWFGTPCDASSRGKPEAAKPSPNPRPAAP